MARVTRKNQKIFAESATNNGVFGSLQANDPTISNDPDTIQGRTAYSQGWNSATYSSEKLPPLEEFQALQYLFSRQLSYLFQEGISEWNADTTYYIGSIAKSISSGNIKVYMSTVNNNKNHNMTDTTRWMLLFDSTVGYALRDMSNLTDAAKNIAYWSTDLSNCIVSIPQDINLELASDGTLTLKSGSILTKTDGTQYQITEDKTLSTTQYSGSGTGYIFCSESGSMQQVYKNVTSGSTLPVSGSSHDMFYNSTDGKIYWYTSSGWTEKNSSLPIAKVTVDNGTVVSIDQVFNGAGYIGHHGFVLPGVSFLRANGRNPDGTLNSTAFKRNVVSIIEMTTSTKAILLQNNSTLTRAIDWTIYKTKNDIPSDATGRFYVLDENRVYTYSSGSLIEQPWVCFVKFDYDDGTVYSFDIEQPIRLDDEASLVGNNTLFGDNNFKGRVEFESRVDLGGDAIVNTPIIGDPAFGVNQVANLDCVQTFFANAIGTPRDVTILWGNGTGVGTPTEFQLSEDFTNFEQIGYMNADDNEYGRTVFIQSTYWLNYLLQNAGEYNVLLGGNSFSFGCGINGYSNTSNPSTTTKLVIGYENNMSYYIFGINRKLTTVPDPLS